MCHFFKSTLIKKDQRTRTCHGGQSLNSMLNRERWERWFWASSEVTCARDLHLTGCCYWKTARTSTSQLSQDSQVISKSLRVSFMFSWACPLNCHMASDTFLSFLLNSHIRWFIDVTMKLLPTEGHGYRLYGSYNEVTWPRISIHADALNSHTHTHNHMPLVCPGHSHIPRMLLCVRPACIHFILCIKITLLFLTLFFSELWIDLYLGRKGSG